MTKQVCIIRFLFLFAFMLSCAQRPSSSSGEVSTPQVLFYDTWVAFENGYFDRVVKLKMENKATRFEQFNGSGMDVEIDGIADDWGDHIDLLSPALVMIQQELGGDIRGFTRCKYKVIGNDDLPLVRWYVPNMLARVEYTFATTIWNTDNTGARGIIKVLFEQLLTTTRPSISTFEIGNGLKIIDNGLTYQLIASGKYRDSIFMLYMGIDAGQIRITLDQEFDENRATDSILEW